MWNKDFLNYFSAIIEFLKVVFKGEIIKFLKNYDIFVIKENRGVKVQIMKFQKIIIIINYQNDTGKPKKLSRSRMMKRTTPLNLSREI